MKLDIADITDAARVCELLNLAYRGAEGWTTERTLVEGNRCSESDIVSDIKSPDNYLLVYKTDNIIQACVSVQKNDNRAYIGSFAVNPKLQNLGIGKTVLNLAEQYAIVNFQAEQFVMVVLSSRAELIQYYERRGYQRNGNIKEYPMHLNVGRPLISNLTIEELIKNA
ncbi:MAG: GNAT family N-acetyltransferase [Gammaproteobacteria bacterium]|nr:GNAT family N-acetyltransferase [Gammaproteobacteria bacterium]